MKRTLLHHAFLFLLIIVLPSCSPAAQTFTPIPTQDLPSLPTNTHVPPLPTPDHDLLTERLGHVWLEGPGQLADYIHREFLQIPVGMAWGPDGFLYVADWLGHHIVRVAEDGSMDDLPFWKQVPALQEDGPYGIAFDSKGSLFINNIHSIYRIDANGSITEFNDLYGNPVGGIAVSPADELYYSDGSENGNIYKLLPDGHSETIAIHIPNAGGMVFGLDGTLYVTQLGPGRMLKVDVNTGKISIFKEDACRFDPCFLAVDPEGDIWVRGFETLRQFAPDGTEKIFFVDGNQYPGGPLAWTTSAGIAFDEQGNLWIGSYQSWLGKLISQTPGKPDPAFTFQMVSSGFYAYSMDLGPQGQIYAADAGSESLLQVNPDGQVEVVINHGADGPTAVAVDQRGKIFLGLPNGMIISVEQDGTTQQYAPILTHRMTFGADGALYAVMVTPNQPTAIVRITAPNTFNTFATQVNGVSFGNGEVHISPALDDGLYVYTETEHNLYLIDFDGQGTLIANLDEFGHPNEAAMAASPVTGDIFIVYAGNHNLYRIRPDGSEILKLASHINGDPWSIVVSADGTWLAVSESGSLDKIPLSP
jgi:sugar lactone lactonase YvrE